MGSSCSPETPRQSPLAASSLVEDPWITAKMSLFYTGQTHVMSIIIIVTLVNCILSEDSCFLLFFFHSKVVFNVYSFTESSAEDIKEPSP